MADEPVVVQEGGAIGIAEFEEVSDHHAPEVDGVAIATAEIREADSVKVAIGVPDVGVPVM